MTTTGTPKRLAQPSVRREIAEIDPKLRAVIRECVIGKKPWPLYIHGPSGTGKTSAALCVLDYYGPAEKREKPSPAISDWLYGYVEARNLSGMKIRAENGENHDWYTVPKKSTAWLRMCQDWQALPVAVIDEIGVGKDSSDWKLDVMIEVLNLRCSDPVRPLIVTGNVVPTQLEKIFDDRVADRILSGTSFKVEGKSRRMPK